MNRLTVFIFLSMTILQIESMAGESSLNLNPPIPPRLDSYKPLHWRKQGPCKVFYYPPKKQFELGFSLLWESAYQSNLRRPDVSSRAREEADEYMKSYRINWNEQTNAIKKGKTPSRSSESTIINGGHDEIFVNFSTMLAIYRDIIEKVPRGARTREGWFIPNYVKTHRNGKFDGLPLGEYNGPEHDVCPLEFVCPEPSRLPRLPERDNPLTYAFQRFRHSVHEKLRKEWKGMADELRRGEVSERRAHYLRWKLSALEDVRWRASWTSAGVHSSGEWSTEIRQTTWGRSGTVPYSGSMFAVEFFNPFWKNENHYPLISVPLKSWFEFVYSSSVILGWDLLGGVTNPVKTKY